MRLFLLSLISIAISACGYEGPTGYKAGVSYPGDSNLVRTCDEEAFLDEWWDFQTNNAIANTLVPSYKDYCTYVTDDFVFYWNIEELFGFYDWGWDWKCVNENTIKATNDDTGDEVRVRIYGSVGDGCYDVKITHGNISLNGNICPCEYNGP